MVTRVRIAVDVTAELRRRVRIAAARRDVSLQEYVSQALEHQVREEDANALELADDPVLSGLWDNDVDAIYDKL